MRNRVWVTLAAVGALALMLGFGWADAGTTQSTAAVPETPAISAPGYVGMNTCLQCHAEVVAAFKSTPHMASAKGCEGCHGPGKDHSESGEKTKIKSFTAMSALDSSSTCMECHNKDNQKHWVGSTHDSRRMACTTCHDPHPKAGVVNKALLKQPQLVLCTSCHLQKKAQLVRPGHMPVREGKLECTSCHNPHGTTNDKMLLQTSINQNCYSCHAEKRGPFLWEHAPVRENCLNCHDPHGSINEKMLKVKAPLLCQQCHQTSSHPGPAYPAQSRYAFNQGCLHCHVSIHGSVHPSGNRFFR